MNIDVEYYVKMIKIHEQQRLSFNERMKFWEEYRKRQENNGNKEE